MPITISTQEVAAMLQVAETTIKRWADEGIIPCVKTPGGHRKFSLQEIARFAERNGYTIAGAHPPPMTSEQLEKLQVGVHTRNSALLASVLKEEALQADREGLLILLLYLYKYHFSLPVILDEIIRPVFERIGEQWERGELEVNQEHASSQAMTEALIRMNAELLRKDANGMSIVCACPEGELHEIGLRGVAYSFELEGWRVHFIGANTPVGTLLSLIRIIRPELVCLSFTRAHEPQSLAMLNELSNQVHSYKGRVIFGGRFATTLDPAAFGIDHIASSIQDAIVYTRNVFELKPGPKQTSERKHH